MHCLKRTATNTGVNPEILDRSVSRGPPAVLGRWDRWVHLDFQEDQDHLDLPDPPESQATEDWVFMAKRVTRVKTEPRGPMGFHQTTAPDPQRLLSSRSSTRVIKEVLGKKEEWAFP